MCSLICVCPGRGPDLARGEATPEERGGVTGGTSLHPTKQTTDCNNFAGGLFVGYKPLFVIHPWFIWQSLCGLQYVVFPELKINNGIFSNFHNIYA